jgi:L-ribulose-5-phosphate 3-epimerase
MRGISVILAFMRAVFRLAAITDEFSPDIAVAARAMAASGLTGAELRMVWGKNVVDLTADELQRAIEIVRSAGLEIVSIASPLLKCVLPGAPEVDPRFQQDSFASRHTFDDQPRLADRVFEIAERTGAPMIRVFSYWRTVRPEECFDRVVEGLRGLAHQAAARGRTIGLENEHACNIATGVETARVLAALDDAQVNVVWDAANALVAGEMPYPDGYRRIPAGQIGHVHAKDCSVAGHTPTWLPLGEGAVDWRGQLEALARDGYSGWLSLETHWPGPSGDKLEASAICARNLKQLADEAAAAAEK